MPFWREKSFDFLQMIYQIFGIGFFIILLERKTKKRKTSPSLSHQCREPHLGKENLIFIFSFASTSYDQRR